MPSVVHDDTVEHAQFSEHRPRKSACATAALQAEIARVAEMTIEERVKAALSMRGRFAWIDPAKKPTDP
jgi:hypothetical protein